MAEPVPTFHAAFVISQIGSPILDRPVLVFRFALRFPLQNLLVALLRVQQPLRLLRRHLSRRCRPGCSSFPFWPDFVLLLLLLGRLILLLLCSAATGSGSAVVDSAATGFAVAAVIVGSVAAVVATGAAGSADFVVVGFAATAVAAVSAIPPAFSIFRRSG